MSRTITDLKMELATVRQQRQSAFVKHVLEKERLATKLCAAKKELQRLNARLGLHPYIDAMKKVNDDKNLAIYAVKQQALVCNALHRIEVEVKQLQLCKKYLDDVRKSMYGAMSTMETEKLEVEKDLINRLVVLSGEATAMHKQYKKTMREQREEIRTLREEDGWDMVTEGDSSVSSSCSTSSDSRSQTPHITKALGLLVSTKKGRKSDAVTDIKATFHRQLTVNNGPDRAERQWVITNVA